jgi:peptidyl-prolyl cis-trans isomerase D
MLDLLRKKAQSPLIQGTILIIALVFIFWGVGTGYRGSRNSVAQVNDESIPYEEFQKAYEQLANRYRNQFGGNLPKELLESLDLEGQTLEQLIQRSLLRQGAREMGITVSNSEVQQAVEKMEAFRTNGIFNVEQYRNILTSSGISPTAFEESMRTDLLAAKVLEHLSRFAKLTPLEIEEEFDFDNEEINIEYVSFEAEDFKEKVGTNPEDLMDFYEKHTENYMTDPQVKLDFLTFPYDTDNKPAIADEEVESFYRQNLNRYTIPEQRSARHILIKTSEEDSEETLVEKREKAEKILKLARSGEDFGALARQYSEGPTGPKGGDLGSFPRGKMVKPFDDAVFSLKEGETSDIVQTQFGFHIIRLEKIEPASTRTIEEAKSEIVSLLQKQKSSQIAFQKATEAYENIIRAGSLEKFSQNSDIPVKQTNFFPRKNPEKSGLTEEMLTEPAFLNAAFALNKGELSSLIETTKGYVIIFAADKKEPEVSPFKDVQEQVKADYLTSQSDAMAKEAAEKMLTDLKAEGNIDLSVEAAKYDKTPKESGYFSRSSGSEASLPSQMIDSSFDLSEKNPFPEDLVSSNGVYYVFRLAGRKTPAQNLLQEKEEEFRTGLLERKKAALLTSWLATVRSKAEIKINKELL